MFESLKTGSARRPQRPVAHGTDALRRVQSCCRTLVVASVLCVAASMPPKCARISCEYLWLKQPDNPSFSQGYAVGCLFVSYEVDALDGYLPSITYLRILK